MYNKDTLRQTFLDFFEEKNHSVLPSSSLIPANDPTLLLINSGMAQFKSYFSGEKKPPNLRITTSQKCFRTTDIEEVGDKTHLTMFEMLGNFSFGDYFKKEACSWALELMIDKLNLDINRIYITVYKSDDEAEKIWLDLGIPIERIYRFGDEDNWWGPAGDEGVCGPSSEINYYLGSLENIPSKKDSKRKENWGPNLHDDFIELYNLVFTQFYRDKNGKDTILPNKNIDTGMGLERMLAVLQNVDNVYQTDVFLPIINQVEKLSNTKWGESKESDEAIRVLAEHARSASFLIGDGVSPSNTGRGYVLRRLIRRGMLFAKKLNILESPLSSLVNIVCKEMGNHYPELNNNKNFIIEVISKEEENFSRTLSNGESVLDGMINFRLGTKSSDSDNFSRGLKIALNESKNSNIVEFNKCLSGKEAFILYDTYGYPVEITIEVAKQNDLDLDINSFYLELENQKQASKEKSGQFNNVQNLEIFKNLNIKDTKFVGYEKTNHKSKVICIIHNDQIIESIEKESNAQIIVSETPFYAERGGQIGDSGSMHNDHVDINISDTQSPYGSLSVHIASSINGKLSVGDDINLQVDVTRREKIKRNHTATHLLQATLREILGNHVKQAGSVVEPEKLRFDFTHLKPLTSEELVEIQNRVNEAIRENHKVNVHSTTYTEAVDDGALAFFGDTYDSDVRTIKITPPWSYELCGGTHMEYTGGIGAFIITSETGIGSGIRRLEAITGVAAEKLIIEKFNVIKNATTFLKVPDNDLVNRIITLSDKISNNDKKILDLEQQLLFGSLSNENENYSGDHKIEIKKKIIDVIIREVKASNIQSLRQTGDHFRDQNENSLIILGSNIDNQSYVVVMCSNFIIDNKFHAGEIAKEISLLMDGGGGGNNKVAQAGAKKSIDLSKILNQCHEIISNQIIKSKKS
ncbi:MAG: alanine--tRNA ligase [Dehalococcoidia bacterium]